MVAKLKWTRSDGGYTETHDGKYEICPEYEGTTRPQSWRLWKHVDGRRLSAGSHFTQKGAKDEAQRLEDMA